VYDKCDDPKTKMLETPQGHGFNYDRKRTTSSKRCATSRGTRKKAEKRNVKRRSGWQKRPKTLAEEQYQPEDQEE